MTKKQKIWFAVFLSMFVLPEVLWSPLLNFYYEFWTGTKSNAVYALRNNFIVNNDNIWKSILLLQTIGLVFSLFICFKNQTKRLYLKWGLIMLMIAILSVSLFAVYFAFSFNPQIG